jgi:hypothetical protein
MVSENAKKGFVIGGVVVLILAAGGFLIYNLRGGSTASQPVAIDEAPPAVSASQIVTVEANEVNFRFIRSGETIATLPVSDAQKTMTLLRQVGNIAYFKAVPAGDNGYILFGSSAPQVVAIDSTNGSVAILKHDGRRIEDISPNGQFVAWTEYLDNGDKNIVVQNVKTNTEQSFPVEKKFTQFGDAYFSPDSAKLAYAAAIGFPGKENGIAYIIDLKTKKVRTVATTSQSNSYYRIHGWRNDGQVDTVLESGDQTGFKMQ